MMALQPPGVTSSVVTPTVISTAATATDPSNDSRALLALKEAENADLRRQLADAGHRPPAKCDIPPIHAHFGSAHTADTRKTKIALLQ